MKALKYSLAIAALLPLQAVAGLSQRVRYGGGSDSGSPLLVPVALLAWGAMYLLGCAIFKNSKNGDGPAAFATIMMLVVPITIAEFIN